MSSKNDNPYITWYKRAETIQPGDIIVDVENELVIGVLFTHRRGTATFLNLVTLSRGRIKATKTSTGTGYYHGDERMRVIPVR